MDNEIQVNSFFPVNIWIPYWKFATVFAKHVYFSLETTNMLATSIPLLWNLEYFPEWIIILLIIYNLHLLMEIYRLYIRLKLKWYIQ
jgi:hypothetical protein